MDNFRRPKRQKRGDIDGIIRSRGIAEGSPSGYRHVQSYRPAAPRRQVGDFKQPAGFRPAERGIVSAPIPPRRPPSQSGIRQSRQPMLDMALPDQKQSKFKRQKPQTGRKQRSWKKIVKRTALAMTLLLVAGGGFMVFNAFMKTQKVLQGGGGAAALQKDVDPTLLKGEGDGRINIMLLGKGGLGHEAPDLTDTLIIASIDPIHKDAALLSIPRDFWVKVPGNGSMKINAVYATDKNKVLAKRRYDNQKKEAESAGLDAIEKTLEATLGIPIHYRTMVDFEAFRKSIDTVGGIDVNVKERLYDPTIAWENGRNPLIASVGMNHFNGKKALLYARSRQTSVRGDFDRSVRQREIIVALKEKVLSAGTFGNPIKITELVNAFGDHVQTNFSVDEIKRLYDLSHDIHANKITSLGLADPPNIMVTTGTVNGVSVVLPKAGAGNYKEIQTFIRTTLRDSYLKSENASVAVLNGTETAGLATSHSEELKSYGYTVAQVADSPVKGNAQTIIVDMRGGTKKYTKHYLEQRFNVSATTKLPQGIDAGTADFVIILGQNETQ